MPRDDGKAKDAIDELRFAAQCEPEEGHVAADRTLLPVARQSRIQRRGRGVGSRAEVVFVTGEVQAMEATNAAFKPGDLVMLKSEGPSMTVVDVGQGGACWCRWMDGETPREGIFAAATLVSEPYYRSQRWSPSQASAR